MYFKFIILGFILFAVTAFDFADKYIFLDISIKEYMMVVISFITNLWVHIYIGISIFTYEITNSPYLFFSKPKYTILILSTAYIIYINRYDSVNILTRLAMVYFPKTENINDTFSWVSFLIHPSLFYHIFKNKYYFHSYSNVNSVLLYFKDKEDLIDKSINAITDREKSSPTKDVCHSCSTEGDTYSYKGIYLGYEYNGNNLKEYSAFYDGNGDFICRTNSPVRLCKTCREEVFSDIVRSTDSIDKSDIISKTI